jgi:hypothetical protein
MILGMRYIVQIDQKLINRKKRNVKGNNLKINIEYVTGMAMMVKESETVEPISY